MAYTDIDKPSDYFNTKLYSGNGGTNAQTGVNFQPDFTWIKARSNAENHILTDSVRGVTKYLRSNANAAEDTESAGITSFNSDGFTLGSFGQVNTNGWTFASWNWKAGTSFTNDASGTGIGSIDSAGSVNTDAGFSIVSYTGSGSSATIAHALGSKPDIIFTKQRDDTASWGGYVSALGATKDVGLNTTGAADADTSYWGDTEPTSTVFTVSSNARSNASGEAYIAYCFTNIKGYSKVGGSYTGNGNADGTFIYTGFKPAFIISKYTGAGQNWQIYDNKRNPHNFVDTVLFPNGNADEETYDKYDFLSNGFKARSTSTGTNVSGGEYIYMAFAENPFVTSTGVPATAR